MILWTRLTRLLFLLLFVEEFFQGAILIQFFLKSSSTRQIFQKIIRTFQTSRKSNQQGLMEG